MEDQCSPLSWGYCHQAEGMKELRESLLYTTLELETTILSAKEEITRREYELIHLKDLLSKTIKERDEAQSNCQKLKFDNLLLQKSLQQIQHQQKKDHPLFSQNFSSEDDSKSKQFSSSDSTKRTFESPDSDPTGVQPPQEPPRGALELAAHERPLPEKGKLLQAVKEAGPLLQTLLLAGPLPQWQHPPPQLASIDIPPVAISSPTPPTPPPRVLAHDNSFTNINEGGLCKKRGFQACSGSEDSYIDTKHQKIVLH